MAVLRAASIERWWGDRQILAGIDLRVGPRDRIGLVGPNGCGKSTLLAILAGVLEPDGGTLERRGRIALLQQDPRLEGHRVDDVLRGALGWHQALLDRYQEALGAGALDEAAALQDRLDACGWSLEHRIDALAAATGAPPRSRELRVLSGGERRRLALAATLLESPELLLLDEPTNHLDASTIGWLQAYLQGYRGAVVMVTHDRYLLEAVCERIVEIENGQAVSYDGSYADYLLARAERHARLRAEDRRRQQLLARESAWAARSPSARSTKQKARLQRLAALREAGKLPDERTLVFDFSTGLRSGGTVLEVHELRTTLGGRTLLDRVSFALRPGDRLGVIGPNGIGKSTLLQIIAGRRSADGGTVHKAPRVKIGLLDQERSGLQPGTTLFEAAGGGADRVRVGGRWLHVASFLERMLFRREQFHARVDGLSGGERARLLLARTMLEGHAVLLLDEPTNDLDLWTLRVLEEAMLAYDGAALIVSHDRAFIDRVCTGVLAFEGEGRVTLYADRPQAERAATARRAEAERAAEARSVPSDAVARRPRAKRRLNFHESRELEALPETIEAAEADVEALERLLADPVTYRERAAEVGTLRRRLEAAEKEVERLYARWEELLALQEAG